MSMSLLNVSSCFCFYETYFIKWEPLKLLNKKITFILNQSEVGISAIIHMNKKYNLQTIFFTICIQHSNAFYISGMKNLCQKYHCNNADALIHQRNRI